MKPLSVLALFLGLVLGFGSLWAAGATKHKGLVKVPARIYVSGNLEGELEPCG
jgi:hypothetical protein